MNTTPEDKRREARPDSGGRSLTGPESEEQRSRIERDAADARNFIDEDEARIIAEGAQVGGELTAQELRNVAARIAKQEMDDELIAARSGVLSGRIMATLFRTQERQERQAAKARDKDRDRSLYLAALQLQLDELNKQIADYDNRIKDFEDRHLSPAEKAKIDALPEDQRRAATDAIFRRKVANGEMSQAEYDQWKNWHADRAKAEAKKDRVTQALKEASEPEIEATVKKEGAAVGEQAAAEIGGEQGQKIDQAVEADRDAGNIGIKNTASTFGDFANGDLLGGTQGADNGVSFAATASPDSQFGATAPDVRGEFQTAAQKDADQAPVAQVNLALDHDETPKGPPVGMNMGG